MIPNVGKDLKQIENRHLILQLIYYIHTKMIVVIPNLNLDYSKFKGKGGGEKYSEEEEREKTSLRTPMYAMSVQSRVEETKALKQRSFFPELKMGMQIVY